MNFVTVDIEYLIVSSECTKFLFGMLNSQLKKFFYLLCLKICLPRFPNIVIFVCVYGKSSDVYIYIF